MTDLTELLELSERMERTKQAVLDNLAEQVGVVAKALDADPHEILKELGARLGTQSADVTRSAKTSKARLETQERPTM